MGVYFLWFMNIFGFIVYNFFSPSVARAKNTVLQIFTVTKNCFPLPSRYHFTLFLTIILLFQGSLYTVHASGPVDPTRSLGVPYRSDENIYYWKNRPPFAGYWQQDVHYQIAAQLDPKTRIIYGSEKLTYFNNSPDTLQFVFFHLYQNAFKPGSYLDQYLRSAHSDAISRLAGTRKGQIAITSITDAAGDSLDVVFDNTIMKVDLNQTLLPGDSTVFLIDFKTYFGSYRRRMNYNPRSEAKQFNAAHWYPRIAVYDRSAGWNTEQHLEREFYGDFGTFEVSLTLPHDYIVAATGYLLNRGEVLPDTLMQKLALENFIGGDKVFPRTLIKPEPGLTKTWRYKAVNVHDFAWTADPSFRIGQAQWNGIRCYAFVRQWKAAYWHDAAEFAADVVRVLSQDFGEYAYHKMIVADVDDGMEYPMITFDGGFSPEYYDLFAHEIGHNWFYGMVGSNETYSAFMDEGFTQFLTWWAIDKLVKTPETRNDSEDFAYANDNRERYSNYIQYYNAVKAGRDVPLETHSDKFLLEGKGRYQYWQTYFKSAVMLFNLQYVLGEELHRRAMAHYFKKWQFCHPQREDFYEAIREYTKWDLRWFFDQWVKRTRTIDYAIEKFKVKKQNTRWLAEIHLQRKSTAIMPIELSITFADGSKQTALIPINYNVKDEGNPLVLPKWTGWGEFNDKYNATIAFDKKPVFLEIDPGGRLADIYRLDNYSSRLPRVQFEPAWRYPIWETDKYKFRWQPKLGYNLLDGMRLGLHLDGGYMNGWRNGDHQIKLQFNLASRFPDEPVSYRFSYTQPINRQNREANIAVNSMMDHGYAAHEISYLHMLSGHPWNQQHTTFSLTVKSASLYNTHYLSTPWFWINGDNRGDSKVYNTLTTTLRRNYAFGLHWQQLGRVEIKVENALPGSGGLYSRVKLQAINAFKLAKINLRTRAFAGYATRGTPVHSMFYASMGSPADWIENGWPGAYGALPLTWSRKGHIHAGGGGNLRGLHSQHIEYMRKSQSADGFAGNRLAGFGVEFGLWNPFRNIFSGLPGLHSLFQFELYGFADAAAIKLIEKDDNFSLPKPVYDGGFGLLWKPRAPQRLGNVFGHFFNFRIDFPLFLSVGEETFKWRWLVGIERAF
ncbi:MAG: M1 family peptidase [Calditrichaeota bacterium]|nr:MAG: M1 family peptidase [Calditrichota bacterium]